MDKEEIIKRTQAAAAANKAANQQLLAEVNGYSFESYWANSASQSYINDVRVGNVQQARLK